MLDKNKKACYNVLSKQRGNKKCLQIKSAKTSRKLKREVNRRRKLKAGLKLKQKGGDEMNVRISGYVDEAFENISSDLHNRREFTACASEIVDALDKYGMRYCEVHTLLECLLKTFYRYSHNSHDDMQIYAVKELFLEKMEEIKG